MSHDVALAVFFGLLSIALAVVGLWFVLGKTIRDFLKQSKQSQVDGKIASLFGYTTEIKTWDTRGVSPDRIASDLMAIMRIKDAMTDEQKTRVLEALSKITTLMKKTKYESETSKLEPFKSHFA